MIEYITPWKIFNRRADIPDPATYGVTGPGWYFWDETEAYAHGPYGSLSEAREHLDVYAAELNKEKPAPPPATLERWMDSPKLCQLYEWEQVGESLGGPPEGWYARLRLNAGDLPWFGPFPEPTGRLPTGPVNGEGTVSILYISESDGYRCVFNPLFSGHVEFEGKGTTKQAALTAAVTRFDNFNQTIDRSLASIKSKSIPCC